MTLEEVEDALRAFTSRLDLVDKILKAGRLGVNMVACFQCGHSGLYMPIDTVKLWGVSYGIGLGPDPVSECWDTEYAIAPPAITPAIRTLDQIAHPVRNCKAQLDLDLVSAEEYQGHHLVLAKDDPYGEERAAIVLDRQVGNSQTLQLLHAEFNRLKGGA